MLKRFLTVFGLMLLYMLVLAAVLLLAILLAGDNETLILVTVLVMLFRFKGEGEPISGTELRAQIQAINQFDAPVMVEEHRGKLVATWKYVDAHWWELLAKAGLTKVYELHIKFDDAQRLVTLIDVSKTVSWRAGPTQVRLRGGFFRGVMLAYEIGKQWGIKENFELGKIYDYKFVPQEIKMPILNSILRSGWDARFGIW
jgi:hypothetical protein